MRAATVVQVLHGLFYVLLQLFVVAAIILSFIVVVISPLQQCSQITDSCCTTMLTINWKDRWRLPWLISWEWKAFISSHWVYQPSLCAVTSVKDSLLSPVVTHRGRHSTTIGDGQTETQCEDISGFNACWPTKPNFCGGCTPWSPAATLEIKKYFIDQ